MFRATVEETESTSPYEVGVGGLEKSLHVEREAAEVEHATVGASRGAGGRGTEISASACSPTRRTEVSGSLTPSSYCELLSFSSPVKLNMPNAASEIVGPCSDMPGPLGYLAKFCKDWFEKRAGRVLHLCRRRVVGGPKNISRATPDPGEAASWERTTTTSSFIWLDDDRSKLTNSLPETYCTAVNAIFVLDNGMI